MSRLTPLRRAGIGIAGLALLVAGTAAIVYGVRAERAQVLYFRCKYGDWQASPDRILAAAERAHHLYPHNYYLCILAAETSYYQRFDAAGNERPDRLAAADRWCRAGLALDPYASQLRMLDTRLTQRHSAAEAARKWAAFVDWDYWEPYNHVVLAELYGRAGRYREALETLALLASQPRYYQDAQRALAQAWQDEIGDMQSLQDHTQK